MALDTLHNGHTARPSFGHDSWTAGDTILGIHESEQAQCIAPARATRDTARVWAQAFLLCLLSDRRGRVLSFLGRPSVRRCSQTARLSPMSVPTSSTFLSQDAVFHGKFKRPPTPLQEALLATGMADPGFLAAYPRTDLAALGLQGVGTTSAHIPGESSGDTNGYMMRVSFESVTLVVWAHVLLILSEPCAQGPTGQVIIVVVIVVRRAVRLRCLSCLAPRRKSNLASLSPSSLVKSCITSAITGTMSTVPLRSYWALLAPTLVDQFDVPRD